MKKTLSPEELAKRRQANKVIFPITAILVVLLFYGLCKSNKPGNVTKQISKMDAAVMAKSFVEQNLKAPATADFGPVRDENVDQLNDTTFTVRGYVDAENTFGAKLRNNYTCTVRFMPNDRAVCDAINIYE